MGSYAAFDYESQTEVSMFSKLRSPRQPCFRPASRPTAHRKLHLETLEDRVNPSLGFGFAVGGDTSGYSVSYATTTDNSGNVYITGIFSGTVHFENSTLRAQGSQDTFVAKYSSSGSLEWVADLGGSGNDVVTGNGIAVDGSGNVYTTGEFSGTNVNFDPNSSTRQLTSSSGGSVANAYVSKLNSSGQYVFGVDLGYGGTTEGEGIAVDGAGNVYTTGYFAGTNVSFDPYIGSDHELSSSSGGGEFTAYVSKLNSLDQYDFAVELGQGGGALATPSRWTARAMLTPPVTL